MPSPQRRPLLVWAALGSVYVIWGSTYFGIRYAIGAPAGHHGFPPLFMSGARFTITGVVMLALFARRPAADGEPDRLGWPQWRATAIIGLALLFGGNGLVTLSEQRIDSSVAAVVIATVPLWFALFIAIRREERLSRGGAIGLFVGFAGVAILSWPAGKAQIDLIGVLMVVGATVVWAAGSVYSRHAPVPRRPLVMTGMEMLCAGVALLVASVVSGDAARLELGKVDAAAWVSFGYLVVFGSMVAFTAYVWLLRNAQLSLVTTYAYVNPVVAVLLGALADEPLTARRAIASAIIVSAVAVIVSTRARPEVVSIGESPEEAVPAIVT